jgi:hypothetical protein
VTPRASSADPASAYRAAIDHTVVTIERRARAFRRQTIAVATLGLGSVVWAAVARTPSALAGLLLLVPVCGCFVLVDAQLLTEWRSGILAAWARRDLDLAALRQAILAHPGLPKGTTEAMLAGLPSVGDLTAEQRVAVQNRRAMAAQSETLHQERTDALVRATAASGILVIAVLAALWSRAWMPLLGLGALPLLPVLGTWMRRRRPIRPTTAAPARTTAFTP